MDSALKAPPLWKIWSNPIFVRYARSRLRPKSLLPWILVVLVGCAFSFFLIFALDQQRGIPKHVAANDAFFPVLVVQMVILLLMGTGSVAAGITREADDGMIAYQRLTPMSPLAKIIGYLFGLPIREYVLFACTLPFSAYAIAAGSIGSRRALLIYSILILSAILYHLTGCVAGTVVKKRRFAGRVAQMMVIGLYFVLPVFGKLGFVFFEYLTLRPVMIETLGAAPLFMFEQIFSSGSQIPNVNFFEFAFTKPEFSILIHCSLITAFVVILHRKWRQENHHLFGKHFAVVLFGYIMLLLVGNAIPLIDSGKIFPGIAYRAVKGAADVREAFVIASLFGLVAMLLGFAFIASITPTREEFTKGLLRAEKLGQRRIPLNADGAPATLHAALIATIATVCWSLLAFEIFQSQHVMQVDHKEDLLRAVPICLFVYLLCFHGLLERFGRRTLLIFALFVWIVPILFGIVLVAANIKGFPILAAGVSALTAPFYMLTLPLEDEKILGNTGPIMQLGAIFGLFAHLLLALFIHWSLRRHKRRIRRRVLEPPHSNSA